MKFGLPRVRIVTQNQIAEVDLRTGQVSLIGVQKIMISRADTYLLEEVFFPKPCSHSKAVGAVPQVGTDGRRYFRICLAGLTEEAPAIEQSDVPVLVFLLGKFLFEILRREKGGRLVLRV